MQDGGEASLLALSTLWDIMRSRPLDRSSALHVVWARACYVHARRSEQMASAERAQLLCGLGGGSAGAWEAAGALAADRWHCS